ncbi:MAG TPA: PRC-barrel domain-containing protein [bacterium]|nr:PRC-barrel domain-containing protein [bacterium]
MQKASDLKGKPVIAHDEGKIVEDIDDIIYNPLSGKILGFLVRHEGLIAKARVIPMRKIKAIGPDAVTIENVSDVIFVEEDDAIKDLLSNRIDIKGRKIMTEGGENLGKVVDIIFDEKSGKIDKYEVSGGLFADAYTGRSYLPPMHIITVGRDVVFVPDSVVQDFQEQEGGLKKAAKETGQKIEKAAGTTKEQTSKAVSNARQYYQETGTKEKTKNIWDEIKSRATDWRVRAREEIEEQRIDRALGRPVTRVIYDQDDNIILNTGDLITHAAIEEARRNDVLDILVSSVYVGQPKFDDEELKAPDQDQDKMR